MPLLETKGAASAQGFGLTLQQAAPVYVEDVFSTALYTGNGSTQTITNEIDLLSKGGLVWLKSRSGVSDHALYDTTRGATFDLASNTTTAQTTQATGLTSFGATGFSINALAKINTNAATYTSWTFRRQPKFFDVVTYTGNGAANNVVAHNLQAKPRFVLVKSTSRAGNWLVYVSYPSSSSYTGYRRTTNGLQSTTGSSNDYINGSIFGTVSIDFGLLNTQLATPAAGAVNNINDNGVGYVVYMFAGSDAGGFGASGTENIVAAGTFITGSGGVATVNLGWEPQWILTKSGTSGPWEIQDVMRGMPVTTLNNVNATLQANSSSSETTRDNSASSNYIYPTATGFEFKGIYSSGPYEYLAIRRPMKTPTSGTSVFYPQAIAQTSTPDSTDVPFHPDLVNTFSRNGTDRSSYYNLFTFVDRLRGLGKPNNSFTTFGPLLISSASTSEAQLGTSYVQLKADSKNITRGGGWNAGAYGNFIYYFMRRAPGFFDVVCYTGTDSARTVNHNLGVVPELMIVKSRDNSVQPTGWVVYNITIGATKYLQLDTTGASTTSSSNWNNTAPTSTVFTLGTALAVNSTVNGVGILYVAYLFASCAGVSKVGSYTGTGSTLQIDCGFTGGARFVLIKRTDSTGDWYVWDSARGIVAGNDPYLLLNSNAAEVTNTDWVDTHSPGFELSNAAGNNVNINTATYIFLAVA